MRIPKTPDGPAGLAPAFALAVLLVLALLLAGCGSNDDDGDFAPYSGPGNDGETGGVTDEESPTVDPSAPTTGGAGTLADNTILAHQFAFAPASLTVSVGEEVTFSNGDDTAHEVEIGGENIGRMEHGESLTWTPDAPGTYDYFCPLHPQMTGTIVVQ